MSNEIDSNKLNMSSFLSMTDDEVIDRSVDSNVGGKVKVHTRIASKKTIKPKRQVNNDAADPAKRPPVNVIDHVFDIQPGKPVKKPLPGEKPIKHPIKPPKVEQKVKKY